MGINKSSPIDYFHPNIQQRKQTALGWSFIHGFDDNLYFVCFLCSASLPVFHRCVPVDISCYAKFAEAFITFVSDNSVVHRVIAGVMTSKEIIMGLCLLALGQLMTSSNPRPTSIQIHSSNIFIHREPDLHQCFLVSRY